MAHEVSGLKPEIIKNILLEIALSQETLLAMTPTAFQAAG
jgi:hypothetical protein